jgi:hypothetical protein
MGPLQGPVLGLQLQWLVPLFGATKQRALINREIGGVLALGGRHSIIWHNNQPEDSVNGGEGISEEMRPGGTCGGRCLPIV